MKITPQIIYKEVQDLKTRMRNIEKSVYIALGILLVKTGGEAFSFVSAMVK